MEVKSSARISVLSRHLCSAPVASTTEDTGRNYGKERLVGKVAFITGAGNGIGRATALLFADQGAKIYISDIDGQAIRETERLVKQRDGIVLNGESCISTALDVTDEAAVEAAVQACTAKFGKVDICFANAGVTSKDLKLFHEIPASDFDKVIGVNVKGVFNCFKYCSKQMLSQSTGQGGSLLATASVAGIRSGAGDSVYSASKAAVVNLCQTVANQLTGTKIRCNAICPGIIETGMTKALFSMADTRKVRHKIGQLNPMLRYGVSACLWFS